jgi:hypothetical protein
MTGNLYVGTMIYRDPDGAGRHEDVVFDRDMSKIVKCMVNYATVLSLNGFKVYGSLVEELDKFWESDSRRGNIGRDL